MKIQIQNQDGTTVSVDATIHGSLGHHNDDHITHVATGLLVAYGSDDNAKALNKAVRWVWANQQPFGVPLRGRGATILQRNIKEFAST